MTSFGSYLLPLRELGREDEARAGVKAATLGHLVREGYPVPEGFVLTCEAFRRGVAKGPAGAARGGCLGVERARGRARRRRSCRALLGPQRGSCGPLRQYQTVLNVRGADGLRSAVSAVRGLGDRLVSGRASPDEWTVRAGTAVRRSGSENTVDKTQVLAVAELARRAEGVSENRKISSGPSPRPPRLAGESSLRSVERPFDLLTTSSPQPGAIDVRGRARSTSEDRAPGSRPLERDPESRS